MNNQRRAEKKLTPDCSQVMLPKPRLSMNRYQRTNGQPLGAEAATATATNKNAPKGPT